MDKKEKPKTYSLEKATLILCYFAGLGYRMQIKDKHGNVFKAMIGADDTNKFTIMYPKKTKLPYESFYAKNRLEAIRQWLAKHHMKNKTHVK